MDNECFELCKEVYEKTGWHIGEPDEMWDYPHQMDKRENFVSPLYTSDYLLEKLPEEIHNETFGYYWRLTMKKGLGGYVLDYENRMWVRDNKSTLTRRGIDSDDMASWKEPIYADTPLKALLKLVIALDDAGVKL